MTWLIGVDEAGYGPNLGPLAIGLSAWRLPAGAPAPGVSADQVDLYEWLSDAVSPVDDGQRIWIADSKRLYKPRGGLAALERALHAVLLGRCNCDTYDALLEHLGADPAKERAALPWHAGFRLGLPCDAATQQIADLHDLLDATCQDLGMAPSTVRARLVFPAEFNALCDHHGTKGAALSHVTLRLVREMQEELDGPGCCVCDKHGGRNRYAALLQHHFPEHRVETLSESRSESTYRWGPPESRVLFAFRTGGESFLPTALASMTAKYVRELSMAALNQFWQRQAPGLRATAGYPQDAKRFKADIAAAQQKLGIDDRVLWRNK